MKFTINSHEYDTTRMPVLDQLNLSRRIAPALSAMVKNIGPQASKDALAAAGEAPSDDLSDEDAKKKAMDFMGIGLEAIAAMSEDDVNWVTLKCLGCVQRKHLGQYTLVARGGTIAFDDLELPEILQIVGKVIQENLGSFFRQRGTPDLAPAQPK